MTAKTDNIGWLTRWYAGECNGDWEHGFGISIETIDNPGWSVRIDLRETQLERATFESTTYNLDSHNGDPSVNWHDCKVENRVFYGAGGVHDLDTILSVFREWVDGVGGAAPEAGRT